MDTPEKIAEREAKALAQKELAEKMEAEGKVLYKGKWVTEEEKAEAEAKLAEAKEAREKHKKELAEAKKKARRKPNARSRKRPSSRSRNSKRAAIIRTIRTRMTFPRINAGGIRWMPGTPATT